MKIFILSKIIHLCGRVMQVPFKKCLLQFPVSAVYRFFQGKFFINFKCHSSFSKHITGYAGSLLTHIFVSNWKVDSDPFVRILCGWIIISNCSQPAQNFHDRVGIYFSVGYTDMRKVLHGDCGFPTYIKKKLQNRY